MKTFEIELRRTSFVTVRVNAKTEDEAEDTLWASLDDYLDNGNINDSQWDVESIEETDE